MVELLPAERDIRIFQRRAALSEDSMQKHDACIVICDGTEAEARLAKLPFGAAWQRLYREAKARGPVSILSARLTANALPRVVAITKASSSAFERLTLATRIWKELSPLPGAKVLLATREWKLVDPHPALSLKGKGKHLPSPRSSACYGLSFA